MNHELRIKKYNLETGRLGEDIARKYLEQKGYIIIDQNYKNKYAEIDLIAQDGDGLVFVEVKTRTGEQFGMPEQSINRDKMLRLIRNARAYMAIKNQNNMNYRIDAVCIVLDRNKEIERIDHYQNITS